MNTCIPFIFTLIHPAVSIWHLLHALPPLLSLYTPTHPSVLLTHLEVSAIMTLYP